MKIRLEKALFFFKLFSKNLLTSPGLSFIIILENKTRQKGGFKMTREMIEWGATIEDLMREYEAEEEE